MKNLHAAPPDRKLEEEIVSIFNENDGSFGYRRIQLALRNNDFTVNHKKVLRLMRKLGLKCQKFTRKSRRYNSYRGTIGAVAKNRMNRRFHTTVPMQKLTTDITEFKCSDGCKLYLSPIMDLYNSEVISYGISMHPTLDFVMEPLEEALTSIKDARYRTTIHSDQGWHYQHNSWVESLKGQKVFQSMSRKGNCLDNAPIENFFGLLKQEMYYGVALRTYEELKHDLETYIHYYNHKRIKQKLTGMSPVQYRLHTSQQAA